MMNLLNSKSVTNNPEPEIDTLEIVEKDFFKSDKKNL